MEAPSGLEEKLRAEEELLCYHPGFSELRVTWS